MQAIFYEVITFFQFNQRVTTALLQYEVNKTIWVFHLWKKEEIDHASSKIAKNKAIEIS